MGYKGVVKDNVIVLEQGVELPEGMEVEVIESQGIPVPAKAGRPQDIEGWWLSEEARRNATDKRSFKRLLDECSELRKQMPKTTDSVKVIHEMRETRANR